MICGGLHWQTVLACSINTKVSKKTRKKDFSLQIGL
jgi:hypothetical protein